MTLASPFPTRSLPRPVACFVRICYTTGTFATVRRCSASRGVNRIPRCRRSPTPKGRSRAFHYCRARRNANRAMRPESGGNANLEQRLENSLRCRKTRITLPINSSRLDTGKRPSPHRCLKELSGGPGADAPEFNRQLERKRMGSIPHELPRIRPDQPDRGRLPHDADRGAGARGNRAGRAR